MLDKEKVIKGLELCEIGSGDRCYETKCPYYGKGCTESLKNDILELLKEQEAVVRCKDCKFRKGWNHCRIAFGSTQTPDDWYCADGERKEDC